VEPVFARLPTSEQGGTKKEPTAFFRGLVFGILGFLG